MFQWVFLYFIVSRLCFLLDKGIVHFVFLKITYSVAVLLWMKYVEVKIKTLFALIK